MKLSIAERQNGSVTILSLKGKIIIGDEVALLRSTLQECSDAGKLKILLNLAEVNYVDSSGLGELVSNRMRFKKLGGEIKLVKLDKKVHELLVLTKLHTAFDIFENEGVAVLSLE